MTTTITPAACKARTQARFAKLNKQCTLAEYEREVANGDYYTESVEVREVVNLTPAEYNEFSNNLLDDREWLAGKGGSNSDWEMPAEIKNFWHMTEDQQESYRAQAYAICIAVQCEGRRTLFINPEGYNYARYVGI